MQINPNNENVLNSKGIALCNLGKYDEAISCFDRILVLNPNATQVLNNKGDVLTKLGRQADAEMCYERASKLGTKKEIYRLLTKLLVTDHQILGYRTLF